MKPPLENEISEWLVEQNLKQFEAEERENFKEAISIRDEITKFIDINSAILAASSDKKTALLQHSLIIESSLIFNTIKNNKQNLNHL